MNDIQFDFDAVMERIEDVLGYVKDLRTDKQYKQLFTDEYCEYLEEKEKKLRKYIDTPFSIMIVGDFKRGKSSFINALLGKMLLPSDVTPETVTVNTISYGNRNTAEIYFENETKISIPIEHLRRESLEPLLQKLSVKPKYISIKDNNEILRSINFIDTPGLNDASDSFTETVIQYLSKADAVMYVVSASFPMALDEQSFLSKIIIPAPLAKVVVIVNMCDCLESEEEIQAIKEFTQRKCAEISSNIEVYAISSLEELHRLGKEESLNSDTSECLEKNFSFLTQTIQSEIIYKKESLKAVNCINHTKLLLRDINAKCLSLKSSLSNQTEDIVSFLNKKKEEIENHTKEYEILKEKISKLIDGKMQEASLWMQEYLLRIKNELQNVCNKTVTDQIEKNTKFYFSDILKKGFESCINCHVKEISEILQTDLKDVSLENSNFNTSSIDEKIDTNDVLDTFDFSERLDVFGFSETLESIAIMPLGLSLLSIIKLVEGFFRENKKNSVKTKAVLTDQLLSVFNSIENKTQESVNYVYLQYKKNIINRINQVFENEKVALMDNLEQAKKIAEDKTRNNDLLFQDLSSVIMGTEKHYKQMCFI